MTDITKQLAEALLAIVGTRTSDPRGGIVTPSQLERAWQALDALEEAKAEPWDNGELGRDPRFARKVPAHKEALALKAVDELLEAMSKPQPCIFPNCQFSGCVEVCKKND